MKRRSFLNATALSGLGFAFSSFSSDAGRKKVKSAREVFSMGKNEASIFTNASITPFRIYHIADTHLSLDDYRGEPFQEYSERMGRAYKSNSHFQTGEELSAEQSFERTLALAKEQEIDFLALTGDIFNFPSEAAIEWVYRKLKETGIPFAYIAGNHDWHYEGMEGSSKQLRDIWTKRLKVMYQGGHTLISMEFYDEVFKAPNLLSILVGHTHRQTLDVKNDIPQLVSPYNATGSFLDISIASLPN